MKEIIPPLDRNILLKELTEKKFVRKTNYGDNHIYRITYQDSPNIMREIGRLREITFRKAGGGTGEEIDIDDLDIGENPYYQLIVWDPEQKSIIGGYRYFDCSKIDRDEKGDIPLATARLFRFSETFIRDYLPYTIELGRSFVPPEYQVSARNKDRKSLYALDNLWDGLGALVVNHPDTLYFFGKVTMYPCYNEKARNLLLYFLNKYFADKDNLMKPCEPLKVDLNTGEFQTIFTGKNYLEDYKILSQNVRDMGENIPPLINSYMNLSPTMRSFGTAINYQFGNVEETGIMIKINDIYEIKKARHILTNLPE